MNMEYRDLRQLARVWACAWVLLTWTFWACGAAPQTVHVLDARPLKSLDLSQPEKAAEAWDTMHALAALQGIVNRDRPRFYLLYCAEFGVETDQFWLDWLRGEDGWLRQTELVRLTSLEDAVRVFRQRIKGLVVYDPAVPATACLASTAAGCDGLLPVRFSTHTNSCGWSPLIPKLTAAKRAWRSRKKIGTRPNARSGWVSTRRSMAFSPCSIWWTI